MEVAVAFAGALISLRLAASLLTRWRSERRPEMAVWAASLLCLRDRLRRARMGCRRRLGRTPRSGSTTSSAGLLTAALLGAGSLVRAGVRGVIPVTLVYTGARDRDHARGRADRRRHRVGDPRRPRSPRALPRAGAGDHRQLGRNRWRRSASPRWGSGDGRSATLSSCSGSASPRSAARWRGSVRAAAPPSPVVAAALLYGGFVSRR